jgi:alkylated DNA nucleotide flippase Atl1
VVTRPPSFVNEVLDLVDRIPPGRVLTYGAVADRLERGSAIAVGNVMVRHGHEVPWWRVVRANGSLPDHLIARASGEWRRERTPVTGDGRVDVARALWCD